MLKKIREMRDDEGFTLIELMVVVLIIAILLAIAIPTFLRVRSNAQDRAAQSSVSDALKAEKAHYTGGAEVYTDNATTLEEIEPAINYDAAQGTDSCTAFADEKCVKVTLLSTDEVLLVAQAATDTFWAIRDKAAGTGAGTFYNFEGDTTAAPTTAADVADSEW